MKYLIVILVALAGCAEQHKYGAILGHNLPVKKEEKKKVTTPDTFLPKCLKYPSITICSQR